MASATASSTTQQFSNTRRKSCDTVCSSNSSCVFHKRKQIHPFASSVRPYILKNTNSTVTQRVLSARLLKLRSLQTQLNDANFHLSEVQRENRALKNLQNRQGKALSKYEGTNADLPKLLQGHEEEIRVLVTKNKNLRKNMKEAMEQQKVKEEELLSLRDQLKSLTLLTKTKNLGERHMLVQQIEELKETLKSSDEKINLLNRKLLLETKNYKHRLNAEMTKTKEAQKELLHAMNEIDRLGGLVEGKAKIILNGHRKRFASVTHKQTGSLTSLASDSLAKDESKTEKLPLEQSISDVTLSNDSVKESEIESNSDHSDIKLETFANEKELKVSFASDVMIAPSENIKARLSAKLKRETNDLTELNQGFEKVSVSEGKKTKCQTNIAHKLEKLTLNGHLQNGLKGNNNVGESLTNCCKDMKTMAKGYGSVVDQHKEEFQSVKSETEKLLSSLRETDVLNSKLRYTNFLATDKFEIPDKDLDLAKEIWNEEFAFKQRVNSSKQNLEDDEADLKADKNGNLLKQEVKVALESKHKLLATLRAIDNGDDIDGVAFSTGHHKKHLKQLENAIDN